MTDTTEITAQEITDEIDTVIDVLNSTMDGHSITAVLMGCAAFIRVLIDDHSDRSERISAWRLVEAELFPEDDES